MRNGGFPSICQTLDARGLKCPLPVLLARKALRGLANGAVLELLATDRGVEADVADLCDATGARLLGASLSDGVHRFLLLAAGQNARAGLGVHHPQDVVFRMQAKTECAAKLIAIKSSSAVGAIFQTVTLQRWNEVTGFGVENDVLAHAEL